MYCCWKTSKVTDVHCGAGKLTDIPKGSSYHGFNEVPNVRAMLGILQHSWSEIVS